MTLTKEERMEVVRIIRYTVGILDPLISEGSVGPALYNSMKGMRREYRNRITSISSDAHADEDLKDWSLCDIAGDLLDLTKRYLDDARMARSFGEAPHE